MKPESQHQCLIYDGAPSHKLPLLANIIRHKLDEGYRCLYLNSAAMVAGMRSTLAAMDIDVAYEISKARLVLSSEPVSTGIKFSSVTMLRQLEDSLDEALDDGYKGLWASGDMTWEFGAGKDFSELLEYEWGLEQIFQKRDELCGICQYHQDTLPTDVIRKGLFAHSSLVINETLSRINPYYMKTGILEEQQVSNHDLVEVIPSLCGQRDPISKFRGHY